MSQGEEPSRKRVSERQLTDRDDVDEVEGGDGGTFRKADPNIMKTRKIAKARGSRAAAVPEPTPAVPEAESVPTKKFSFATAAQDQTKEAETKKEEPKVATPEKANGEKKEETPVKETTKEGTPTKAAPAEASTTPAKETTPTTPAKEEAKEGEKEGTPSKDGTPAKEEAPKPFSFPTTFSFPTSFTSTPFSFPTLSSTTTPAFSSTTTPAFSGGFNFPAVNFSAGGSSIFGSGAAAKKEGSDDEGDDAANPEEEVAITGPSKLPIVPTVTGEEDETTLFSVRAKLYAMAEGKWQERGVGQLKLNKGKDGKCRLLMRDQGGKHLRLNTSLFPEMKVDKTGDKSVQFVAVGTGGGETTAPAAAAAATPAAPAKAFTTYAVRVGRKEEAEELLEALQKHKGATSDSAAPAASTATSTTSSDST